MEFDRSASSSGGRNTGNERAPVEHHSVLYANGGTRTSGGYQILSHPHPVDNIGGQASQTAAWVAATTASAGDMPRTVAHQGIDFGQNLQQPPGNIVYLNCYNPELLAGNGQSE